MVSTIIAFAASAVMSATTPAIPVEWTHDQVKVQNEHTASSISPSETDKPGVMLQCAGDTMSAIFAVEPIDFDTINTVKTKRTRTWTGKLFIDGELVDERDWVYLPALKAAWPRSKLVATKVFNAIINGQIVEFELGKKERIRVHLPSPDQAFTDFATDCQTFRESTQ